ncbi:hypothetical protein VNO80_24008 [Phaseolus coccineus]|uniref:Uncharacterized protein n=1 Tax=Phaseolus coccineus TaxID=3886 RepID=A0AAN9LS28_PHACN
MLDQFPLRFVHNIIQTPFLNLTLCFPLKSYEPLYFELEVMDQKAGNSSAVKKINSACDVEALKKCLEENKGDYAKCQTQIEAFKSSCSLKKPNPSLDSASR